MFNVYSLVLIYHLCVPGFPSLHIVHMQSLVAKMSITKASISGKESYFPPGKKKSVTIFRNVLLITYQITYQKGKCSLDISVSTMIVQDNDIC